MVKGRINRLGVLAGLVLGMGAAALSRGAEAEGFVYSSFTGDGEDGLHLLTSLDGVTWQHVSGYRSVFKQAEGLMRDPSICRGGDGKYHLVWTTGWWSDTLGISHSDNLKDWEPSRFISVWADYRGPGTEESDGRSWPADLSKAAPRNPKVRNCWAPEIFCDEQTKEYVIFWATTIDDASVFPKTWDAKRWERMNQRIYFITTKDFKTYTPRRFFYAPADRMVIDAMIRRIVPGDYRMIIKDEMEQTLHVCSSTTRLGTWANLPTNFWSRMSSPAFTGAGIQPDNTPAEGPSLVQSGAEWLIYCDYWSKGRNGLFSTRDFVTMTRLNEEFHAPNWVRHGTVFKVPMAVLKALSPDHAPVYMRAMGVENVTVNSARLKGRVTYASGAGTPVVSVYWGPVNRDRDKAAWRNRIEVGPIPVGREFEVPLTGLVHNTPYYYTFCGSNSDGTGWSSVATFQTLTAVDVSTADATEIGLFSARLNGRVNPCDADAAMWFEYGPGTDVSHSTAKGRAGSANHFVAFSETIAQLEPDTVYTFRGMAENAAGWSATGTNGTFRTRALVATLEATHLGVSSATLNGEVNPNNRGSYVWFEQGTTTNYGARTPSVSMGSGNASLPFSRELVGLTPNTLYHCRAMSSNVTGVVKAGADTLFQTLPSATMLTYDFDDGTLQGWTTVSADPGTVKDGQRYVATDWDKTHKGPKAVFCSNFGARDNAHQTLWIRSPAFLINQPGNLTLWLLGGAGRGEWPGRTGTLPTQESQIPLAGQSTLDGVMGVALRDTATGEFVLTGQRTTSAGGANWTQIVWDVKPFLNNGRTYTVELFDYHSGNGYSQLALDTVTIPGKLAPSSRKPE